MVRVIAFKNETPGVLAKNGTEQPMLRRPSLSEHQNETGTDRGSGTPRTVEVEDEKQRLENTKLGTNIKILTLCAS